MNHKMSLITYTSLDPTLFSHTASHKIFYGSSVYNMSDPTVDAMVEWMGGDDNLCRGEVAVAISLLHV